MTLRYRTSNPLEVNMTILNSIPIGGRDHAFLCVSLDNVASPEKLYSAPPANRNILHTRKSAHCPKFPPAAGQLFRGGGRGEGGRLLPLYDVFGPFPFTTALGRAPFSLCGVEWSGDADEDVRGVEFR